MVPVNPNILKSTDANDEQKRCQELLQQWVKTVSPKGKAIQIHPKDLPENLKQCVQKRFSGCGDSEDKIEPSDR